LRALLYDVAVIAIRFIGQLMLSFVTYLGELSLLCASIG
jgi:hypothetical protein